MKVQWVKWKSHQGAKYRGIHKYNPPQPWGPWSKIMGVVARCEGNMDTVVSYDGTGLTFGFLQWTFTSGRLQKLLESFKSIPCYNFTIEGDDEDNVETLFDDVCRREGVQRFENFGFKIEGGRFFDICKGAPLDPRNKSQKKRIDDICMGRIQYPTSASHQKVHAMALARLFAEIGADIGVHATQIYFGKQEFKRALLYKRPPLGDIKTIDRLLMGTWDTPAPALFFNLWQNSPGAAYRLFKKVFISMTDKAAHTTYSSTYGEDFFDLAWKFACKSKFGNWGFGKKTNKSPRVVRIKKAMKEFYGVDLKLYK